ncbi:unnamed protein product, partial [Iphiclides podalirius]
MPCLLARIPVPATPDSMVMFDNHFDDNRTVAHSSAGRNSQCKEYRPLTPGFDIPLQICTTYKNPLRCVADLAVDAVVVAAVDPVVPALLSTRAVPRSVNMHSEEYNLVMYTIFGAVT